MDHRRHEKLKTALLTALLGGLLLLPVYVPWLEQLFPQIQRPPLAGAFERIGHPTLLPGTFLSKAYPRKKEAWLKQESPLTPLFVRAKNELDFRLFRHLNNRRFVLGRDSFFFSKSYLESATGKNYLGRQRLLEQARTLKVFCERLDQLGVPCVVVNPPAKFRQMPEKAPAHYACYPVDSTNWTTLNYLLDSLGVPRLPLDFLLQPFQGKIPTYPQMGLHWNYLGLTLMADSLRSFLERGFGLCLPELRWEIEWKTHPELRNTDLEIMRGANLWSEIPSRPQPYPRIRFEPNSCPKPNVLIIGDSYFQMFYDYGLMEGLFAPESTFFYYGLTLFPEKQRQNASDPLSPESLQKRDLVILSHSEDNLHRLGFGVIQ